MMGVLTGVAPGYRILYRLKSPSSYVLTNVLQRDHTTKQITLLAYCALHSVSRCSLEESVGLHFGKSVQYFIHFLCVFDKCNANEGGLRKKCKHTGTHLQLIYIYTQTHTLDVRESCIYCLYYL